MLQCVSGLWYEDRAKKDIIEMLLFVAGETVDDQVAFDQIQQLNRETELNLKLLCRKMIRKHLLEVSPVNLFYRVSQLGLISILNEYLLFGLNIDEDDSAADDEDEEEDDDDNGDDDGDVQSAASIPCPNCDSKFRAKGFLSSHMRTHKAK